MNKLLQDYKAAAATTNELRLVYERETQITRQKSDAWLQTRSAYYDLKNIIDARVGSGGRATPAEEAELDRLKRLEFLEGIEFKNQQEISREKMDDYQKAIKKSDALYQKWYDDSKANGNINPKPTDSATGKTEASPKQSVQTVVETSSGSTLNSSTTIVAPTRANQEAQANVAAAGNRLNLHNSEIRTMDPSEVDYHAKKVEVIDSQEQLELSTSSLEETVAAENAGLSERLNLEGEEGEVTVDGMTTVRNADGTDTLVDSNEIVVTAQPPPDERVRIRLRDGQEATYYGTDPDHPLAPLRDTNGVIFPYSPTIQMTHKANYSNMAPTHANTEYYVYTHSPAVSISISGQFTAQNLTEARYLFAAQHFFKTVTKMHFGESDDNRGLPPPVLLLSGYGDLMFGDLNVIITDFSMDLPNNVQYYKTEIGTGTAWVPVLTTFNITCVVQQTSKKQREEFNIERFADGSLLTAEKGWI